jgi:hypothetical protein
VHVGLTLVYFHKAAVYRRYFCTSNMVEGIFRDLTVTRMRRGVFHSLP